MYGGRTRWGLVQIPQREDKLRFYLCRSEMTTYK